MEEGVMDRLDVYNLGVLIGIAGVLNEDDEGSVGRYMTQRGLDEDELRDLVDRGGVRIREMLQKAVMNHTVSRFLGEQR